jgi:uncharacterized membrane protein YhaH (DUF805 family)
MFNYFKECLTTKYADFNGRARRSEYWYFVLFYFITLFFILPISSFLGKAISVTLFLIFILGTIVPVIALRCRRMHDTGNSGWFMLIPIYNMILTFTDSQPGTNEYGPNPKEIGLNENNDDVINSIGKQ